MPTKITGLDDTRRLIRVMARKLADPSDAMAPIGRIIVDSIVTNFEVGGRPRWKPLKASTIRRKKRNPDKVLIESQTLMDSITSKVDRGGRRVTVGTNVRYARIHQFGFKGTVEQRVRAHTRRGRPVRAFTRTIRQNIPARPFIKIQREDMIEIRSLLEAFILRRK